MHAPGYKDYSASLEAAYNLLTAHGRAVKLFRDMRLKGDIGITIDHQPFVPFSDTDTDKVAARNMDGLINRLYFDPIFKGRFPQDVLDLMEKKGCTLPEIREEDMRLISQKIDFLGINYYFINHVRYDNNAWPLSADVWPNGKDLISLNIPLTDRNWTIEPDGLTETLLRMKNEYGVENVYITENGASYNDVINVDGVVADDNRIDYLRRHLVAAHNAMLAGVNLKGYFVWSFSDNYEWNFGKYSRFGLVHVDFETQKRIIKKSGYWFRDVVSSNGLD
jgi:beta-glucosidase